MNTDEQKTKCARIGCNETFEKKTLWHRFHHPDCKYIDWAERKKRKLVNNAKQTAKAAKKKTSR